MSEELKACFCCGKNSGEFDHPEDGMNYIKCSNYLCEFYNIPIRVKIWQSRPIEDALQIELEEALASTEFQGKQVDALRAKLELAKEAIFLGIDAATVIFSKSGNIKDYENLEKIKAIEKKLEE